MSAQGSRLGLYLGVAVAGAGGYYLYTAGGDPKVAKKEVEHDAARVSSAIKSELPGRGKEAQKQGEEWASKAGSQIDRSLNDARAKLDSGEAKLDQYRRETGRELKQKIDEVDRKVEEGAAKAKSGLSSWFK